MSIMDQLDAIRDQFPDCVAAGLGDISSGIVLCVSSEKKLPQERLDAFCAAAAETLKGSVAQKVTRALPGAEAAQVLCSIVLNEDAVHLFLRSQTEPSDALFFFCKPGIDLAAITSVAQRSMASIASET